MSTCVYIYKVKISSFFENGIPKIEILLFTIYDFTRYRKPLFVQGFLKYQLQVNFMKLNQDKN